MSDSRVILFLSLLLLLSCKQGKFTEQKYTGLKPIAVNFTDNISHDTCIFPEDTLKKGNEETHIYLKTEKGYYILEEPSLDSLNSIISAGNIRRTKGLDSSRIQVIIYIKEKNYYIIDEIELKKADSIFYREQLISKDSLSTIIKKRPIDPVNEISSHSPYKRSEKRKLKILSIVLGIMTIILAMASLTYFGLGSSIDPDQGCLGGLFVAGFLAFATFLAYIAGAFFLLFLIVLILYFSQKNRL